jgi:hypothetical protein
MIRSADLKKIREILGGRGNYLKIPPFQRSFSWTGDQAKDLFDDITDFVKVHQRKLLSAEYFLGSIVAFPEGDARQLIDGQQRIASLTILAACIRDRLQEIDPNEAGKLHVDLIQEELRSGRGGERRNKLTLNNDDQPYFHALVQTYPRPKIMPRPELASTRKILQVRNKFDGETCLGEKLKKKTKAQQKSYLLDLSDAISNCLTVVLVEAENEDSGSDVFEVLNERGLGLSIVDLVRNFLIGKAKSAEEKKSVVDKWSTVLSVSENSSKIQNFLRHFWIVRHGDVKTRGLYRVIKTQLKKDFSTDTTTAVKFSEELAYSSQTYKRLLEGSTGLAELDDALSTVSELEATPIYPVLLATIEETDAKETLRVCNALISLYVRWTIIGRKESTALETHLFGLAEDIHGGLGVDEALKRVREFSLNDEDFEKAFLTAKLTKSGQRRPILDALEKLIRRQADKDELRPDVALHVEHIYPQNPGKSWGILEDHDEWVNRIGNLTLLKGSKNSKIGNKDFLTVKRPEMERSELEINVYVSEQTSWGTKQITERQAKLASAASLAWPLPPVTPANKGRKRTAAKKTPAKKTPVKKTAVKKTPAKKTAVKKTPAKKTPVKKTAVKKTPAKKTPATKTAGD